MDARQESSGEIIQKANTAIGRRIGLSFEDLEKVLLRYVRNKECSSLKGTLTARKGFFKGESKIVLQKWTSPVINLIHFSYLLMNKNI